MMHILKCILMSINRWDNLPTILLGIVVAYLTILISVAIAIFNDTKEFETLDRNLILDHIINAKGLMFALGLTFFPLLFWHGSLPCIRLLELISWIVGTVIILKILINSYHWMKGNKFRLRFSYLSKLKNSEDMEEAWRSVWQTENINTQNEQEFFKIFHYSVNRSLENDKKDSLVIASKLLGDFNNFLDNRSTEFLIISGDTLDNILQWHFAMWEKEYKFLDQADKIDTWIIYKELSRTIDSIFQKIEIRTLKSTVSISFFKKLEKHAEKYKNKSVSSHSYAKSLFDTFYQTYFENIYDSPDRFEIWNHYFPKTWTVTKGNLLNPENIICRISCDNFFEWARDRIWQASEEKDFSLNDVSANLFPEVDPVLWAKILIFTSYNKDDRLHSVIERPWNFGFFGRVKVYNAHQKDEIKRDEKNEETNTFDLAFLIFRNEFSKVNLEDYIKSLEKLQYPEGSVKEGKRLRLLDLFTKMLHFLDN